MKCEPGDSVRLYAGTKEGRPDVVMRETEGRLVVLTGTTTDRSDVPHERVSVPSAQGRALGLAATTWFTARGVEVASPGRIDRVVGRCPPSLFLRLARLIGV